MVRKSWAIAIALVICSSASAGASLNPDGSLQVNSSLQPLPAPVAGQPLFDRRSDGHLQVGMTAVGRDGGVATARQDAGLVGGMGGTIMRVHISWANQQPAQSQYNWQPSDDMYVALATRGLRPLFYVDHVPAWLCGCNQPPSDANTRNAYAQFLSAVAQRYPLAAAIEVWNEPNNVMGSPMGPDPVAYAQLLAASYDAVKQARPAMRVLGGSLGNFGAGGEVDDERNMRLDEYLAAMEDNGAATHMDGLSFHPYPKYSAPNPSNNFYAAFDLIAGVLSAKGDAARRLVPTELGLTSDSITEESTQSSTLLARYHDLDVPVANGVPDAGQVDAVIFHTDINNVQGGKYGWTEPIVATATTPSTTVGFRPHAVWCSFAQMLAGLNGCPGVINP
jgi:hypothetical protein